MGSTFEHEPDRPSRTTNRASVSSDRDRDRDRPGRLRTRHTPAQRKSGRTGLPAELQTAVEQLSGQSMDGVQVHYGSSKPTRIQALAYTQGQDIELAPGQEHHLPHESWHVVQQMQGRVRPMRRVEGVPVNSDQSLEREADVMGARARALGGRAAHDGALTRIARSSTGEVAQRVRDLNVGDVVLVTIKDGNDADDYDAKIASVSDDGSTYEVTYLESAYNGYWPKEVEERAVKLRRAAKVTFVDKTDLSTAPWESSGLGLDEDSVKAVKKIAGGAGRISWLSEEQLEEMIAYFAARKEPPSSELVGLIKDLTDDLAELKLHNEPAADVLAREQVLNTEITKAENEAFEARFKVGVDAATWNGLLSEVKVWFAEVKASEAKAKDDLGAFNVAYTAHRMTARQINVSDTARGGKFEVKRFDRKSDEPERTIVLDNTVKGVAKRLDPGNFEDRKTQNDKGVHDLSASLLDGTKTNIYKQLKSYQDCVALFMPLPEEKDLRILSALARVRGVDEKELNALKSLMTHPKFAQASDMGTTFVDTDSGPGPEGSFQYGVTGTVIRKKDDRARKINAADRAARRKGALFYTEVATAAITTVNEIVMAYRRHESEIFPMYARWEGTNKGEGHFIVVTPDQKPTGMIVTNDGHYRKA